MNGRRNIFLILNFCELYIGTALGSVDMQHPCFLKTFKMNSFNLFNRIRDADAICMVIIVAVHSFTARERRHKEKNYVGKTNRTWSSVSGCARSGEREKFGTRIL